MRRTVGGYGLFAKNDLKAAVKIEFSDMENRSEEHTSELQSPR